MSPRQHMLEKLLKRWCKKNFLEKTDFFYRAVCSHSDHLVDDTTQRWLHFWSKGMMHPAAQTFLVDQMSTRPRYRRKRDSEWRRSLHGKEYFDDNA